MDVDVNHASIQAINYGQTKISYSISIPLDIKLLQVEPEDILSILPVHPPTNRTYTNHTYQDKMDM